MKTLRLIVLIMMTALLMVGCGGDDKKEDSIKMEDIAGVYEYMEDMNGYIARDAYAFYDDGVGLYLWYNTNSYEYQKSEAFDYEIDGKTITAYVHEDTLEFSISKVDGNYQLTLSIAQEWGEPIENIYSHIDMDVPRLNITGEIAINTWEGAAGPYSYKYVFSPTGAASLVRTYTVNDRVTTSNFSGSWDYMMGMMGIEATMSSESDPASYYLFRFFLEGDSLNPTLSNSGTILNINYDALFAGVYQTADMGGMSEYICLWDDKSGETGGSITGYGNSRDYVVTWEATSSTLTLTYALEYPWAWNRVTDTYNITKNGDVIILTDQEDPDYVYTKTTSLEVTRVVMTSDQVVGTWIPSYGGENVVLSENGNASVGDDSNQKWEFAASPHVIYVIDSENYWVELTGVMDNGTLKLKDLDNSITYTKQ
jgi:hypothetical protein